jgi:hypothetical protein
LLGSALAFLLTLRIAGRGSGQSVNDFVGLHAELAAGASAGFLRFTSRRFVRFAAAPANIILSLSEYFCRADFSHQSRRNIAKNDSSEIIPREKDIDIA